MENEHKKNDPADFCIREKHIEAEVKFANSSQKEIAHFLKRPDEEPAGLEVASRKLYDQSLLAEIVTYYESHDSWARWSIITRALDKMTDLKLLADIVKNIKTPDVLLEAKKRLGKVCLDMAKQVEDPKSTQDFSAEFAKKAEYVRQCFGVAKQLEDQKNAQSIFAELAKKADDTHLRLEAARLLDDKNLAQSVYADIVKNTKAPDMRYAAVKRLDDKKMLEDLCEDKEDKKLRYEAKRRLGNVYLEAERKLNEQKFYIDRAQNDNSLYVRFMAAERLSDQTLAQNVYIDFAKNAKLKYLRFFAAKRLYDRELAQTVYDDLAKDAEMENIRLHAAENLTKKTLAQSYFADIAKNAKEAGVRLRAAKRLDKRTLAQSCFAEIAKNNQDTIVCLNAIEELSEQSSLADIAKNAKWAYPPHKGVEQPDFDGIAQKVQFEYMRFLDEKDQRNQMRVQAFFADLDRKVKAAMVCLIAIMKLTDQKLLADIAMNAEWAYLRLVAAEKLSDKKLAQSVFADIAKNTKDNYVQNIALGKLPIMHIIMRTIPHKIIMWWKKK